MMAMPRVSNSSLQKDNDSFFLAFLYILLAVAAELTDRELFKIWCTMCLIIYPSKEEEERRFGIFQQALARPPTDGVNRIGYADQTPDELEIICRAMGATKVYHFSGEPNASRSAAYLTYLVG